MSGAICLEFIAQDSKNSGSKHVGFSLNMAPKFWSTAALFRAVGSFKAQLYQIGSYPILRRSIQTLWHPPPYYWL